MGTPIFTLAGWLAPLQSFVGWIGGRGTPSEQRAASERASASRQCVPWAVRPAARAAATARRPLRVVRMAEPGASRAHGGRMVISGRLADVCAELDRLAALEAAAS